MKLLYYFFIAHAFTFVALNAAVLELKDEQKIRETIAKSPKALLIFTKNNCPACTFYAPIIEEIANDPSFKEVAIIKYDLAHAPTISNGGPLLSQTYDISVVPTTIFFVNGTVKAKEPGVRKKEGLENLIKQKLNIAAISKDKKKESMSIKDQPQGLIDTITQALNSLIKSITDTVAAVWQKLFGS